MVVLPNVIQESGALNRAGTISPTTEEEEVTVWIDPAYRTPARAGNICRGGHGLRSVRSSLVGQAGRAAAGNPGPLFGCRVELPEVVEDRAFRCACSRRVKAESAEQPDIPGSIGP